MRARKKRDLYVNLKTLTITDKVGNIITRFGTLYDLERWLYRQGKILVPIGEPH